MLSPADAAIRSCPAVCDAGWASTSTASDGGLQLDILVEVRSVQAGAIGVCSCCWKPCCCCCSWLARQHCTGPRSARFRCWKPCCWHLWRASPGLPKVRAKALHPPGWQAMGRVNFGCDTGGWDFKGLTSGNVTLGGQPLRGWEVFPLPLDDVSGAALRGASRPEGGGSSGGDSGLASARRRLLGLPLLAVGTGGDDEAGAPAFYRWATCGDHGTGWRSGC